MREVFMPLGGSAQVPGPHQPAQYVLTEAMHRCALGDFDQALPLLRQAWAEAGEEVTLRADIAAALADCHANLGELDEALDWADQAVALTRTTGVARRVLLARERRAFYLAWVGRADTAAMESADVVTELRALAQADPAYQPDLARALDHRAEILERDHRFDEAIEDAEASCRLRQTLGEPIALARSQVTLARLLALAGKNEAALSVCKKMAYLVGDEAAPADLRAQIASLHGRLAMQAGDTEDGATQLLAGARLFRRLAREGEGSAIFRDALAEIQLDLGRLHMTRDARLACACFARATAWKRAIERDTPHPFHRAGFASALVWLGLAERSIGLHESAIRHFDLALTIFRALKPAPAGAADLALRMTEALTQMFPGLALATTLEHGLSRFKTLAKVVARAAELNDGPQSRSRTDKQQAFLRLWLTYFIDHDQAEGVLAVLSFAHGQRMQRLTDSRRRHAGTQSEDELAFLQSRHDLIRLDMEMAEILSTRSPSLLSTRGESESVHPAGAGRVWAGAGQSLERERERRYRAYLTARDRLFGSRRKSSAGHVQSSRTGDKYALPEVRSRARVVWCVPQALGVERPPVIVLSMPGMPASCLLAAPDLLVAQAAYEHYLAVHPQGRTGLRGAGDRPFRAFGPASAAPGATLWHNMEALWSRIIAAMPDIGQIDLVTHAQSHNLPWLGTCPAGVTLRQYPSLHHLRHRHAAQPPKLPSATHPLVLIAEDGQDEPANTLYFVSLEAAAIRLAWPDTTVDVDTLDGEPPRRIAALWIAGHGFTERGHPWLGRGPERQSLATLPLFAHPDADIGLVYASTCYLGQTTDIAGEPVGLTGLAALRDNPPLTIGAVAPVDDLAAALLAILFIALWKELADARQAFVEAKAAFASGCWPDGARDLLHQAMEVTLPDIRRRAQEQSLIRRTELARHYPDLSDRERLTLQYRIRKQAQACLEEIERLKDVHPGRIPTANHVADSVRLWSILG